MRTPLVAGNWKMNHTLAEGIAVARALVEAVPQNGVEVVVAPTFVSLAAVGEALRPAPVHLAAQNMHWAPDGAYTGEISGPMLVDAGCRYVILGHSERRQHFQESDELINRKVRSAISHGLHVILCVGESLEEREADRTMEKVEFQVRANLVGVSAEQMSNVVIAYEPIWAIGTGKTASPEQAQEVHGALRSLLEQIHDAKISQATRILYGGSVKPTNMAALIAKSDIDGALVGGASLKAQSFLEIARAAMS